MTRSPSSTGARAALLAAALLLLAVVLPGPAGAQTPRGQATSDPAALAARWLASQVNADGYVEATADVTGAGAAPGPDASATRDLAFALAATGLEEATFGRALGWIESNLDAIVAPDGEPDGAGDLGVLIMLAVAVGIDPTDFAGVDLVSRLEATLGVLEPGLYGASDPTFDGVLRQSLALLGLTAAGVTPDATAVTWLRNQQCEARSSAEASVGGFAAYRDPSVACPAPDPTNFVGAEVDATAVAAQFLVAAGGPGDADAAAAVDFLGAAQSPDGGFAWFPGDVSSPNSTALAIGALVAAGEDPSAAVAWLGQQQFGCDSPDAGAFTSSFSEGGPDQFATRQAILGVAEVALPLGVTSWTAPADPCGSDPASGDARAVLLASLGVVLILVAAGAGIWILTGRSRTP